MYRIYSVLDTLTFMRGCVVQVTDFGLSVVKGGVTADDMMQEFCGTPIYMGLFLPCFIFISV